MIAGSGFERFMTWIHDYDPQKAMSESDVETHMIVPLFQSLGYPDDCHRSQFPVPSYEPGRRGRKRTIDHIYFSAPDIQHQNRDTALAIVEAKKPKVHILEKAMTQARTYGDNLSPLLLVVTNGDQIIVAKRLRQCGDEVVFDLSIKSLLDDEAKAHQFFDLLSFSIICPLKLQLANPIIHERYVQFMLVLDRHPDLTQQIAQGDFSPSHIRAGQHLTVITPKVAIICDVPLVFGEGQCQITFSSLLLRGLTCFLNHRQIIETLITGLGTEPTWGTRPFLKRIDDGTFEAHLGPTSVLLSEPEALDLCKGIDEVCQVYKQKICNAEDILETWKYPRCSLPGFKFHGFSLLSVTPQLWEAMIAFAREFDSLKGSSPWHIFDTGHNHMRVIRHRKIEHVQLYPLYGSTYMPNNEIDILYRVDADDMINKGKDLDGGTWQKQIGPNGRWTAQYTERWLRKDFIPKVIAHNVTKPRRKRIKDLVAPRQYQYDDERVPFGNINNATQLAPYLHVIQSWFYVYNSGNLAASFISPYYSALVEVVKNIDPISLGAHYITYIYHNVMAAIRCVEDEEREENIESFESLSTFLDDGKEEPSKADRAGGVRVILSLLHEHVLRIRNAKYESPRVASFISSALIALTERGTISLHQEQLNDAIESMKPLLETARFEDRYIFRPQWE